MATATVEWVCKHPGFPSGIDGWGMLPVHPCSAKENPDLDPAHINPEWGHGQHGCGWQWVAS